MQNGLTLPKEKRQQLLSIYLSTCVHATTLRNKELKKNYEKWVPFIWQRRKKKKNKIKQNTAKQSAKLIVHLENGTCRKLMPYHQDLDLFLRNHNTVKNIFIYFIKECFRNMKLHFPCLTILIPLFFKTVFEIQFSFLQH